MFTEGQAFRNLGCCTDRLRPLLHTSYNLGELKGDTKLRNSHIQPSFSTDRN